MIEQWRQIEGARLGYMVSSLGNVKGIRKDRLGKFDNGLGYLQTKIVFEDGSFRFMKIHRLVAAAFVPNPEGLPDVNHIDGDKRNNAASNLEWTSHSDNVKHAYMTGLHGYKTKASGNERLTAEQVRAIRASDLPQYALSEIYGVSQALISNIKSGKIYAWVK